ncbi:unnamed protein product [Rotaria sp. Silwood2]|nr:unnamed protein product [Rotaria sp. Silwood2]CAF2782312.1 unnamed protein product [Rotaria sp. Silwood2]CAF3185366.1 unnamed protein product [Rotaria sp. Silwood2]CAF3851189.1 unnamed protein product [Rotaria sp. Silwood2]CAF4086111.1 unnamed protein product [Rotaria sp. Silwood2]
MFFLLRYFHVVIILTFNIVFFSSAYDVGVDYHATGTNFTDTVFITQYHIPSIRSIVLAQLQGITDKGATFVSLRIWFVAQPDTTNDQHWQATFPMSVQETINLHQYAEDVASIQSTIDGHRLHLDVCLLWLGVADYTIGNLTDGFGYYHLNTSEFTSRVEKTMDSVLQALANVKRPDGVLLVKTIYLEGEVMIGAKANQDWFLSTHYPRFIQIVTNANFTPAIYFLIDGLEEHVLQADYIDAQFPALNGHRSMYWVYRSLNFLKTQKLPLPLRIDFSCYIDRDKATYANLTKHIFNDASASLSVLGAPDLYGVAETYYFVNNTQRKEYGQAFAIEALSNSRLNRLSFWTTPDAGGKGINVAYPFAIEDFLLPSSY